jgi:DNA-binding MarR family transcriptional regulator
MVNSPDDNVENPFSGHLGYMLRRASNSLMGELARQLESAGLKISEASILLLVEANPRVTQSEIGRVLGINRANMAPLTGGLELRGLVRRERVNGRSQGLVITGPGTAACDNARRIMAEGERRILDRLGGDDRLARTVLQRLCD